MRVPCYLRSCMSRSVFPPHRCPLCRSLPAVTPYCALLAPGVLLPPLPRQHSRRLTRDHYLCRIRLLACDQRKINRAHRPRTCVTKIKTQELEKSSLWFPRPSQHLTLSPSLSFAGLSRLSPTCFFPVSQSEGFPSPLMGQQARKVRSWLSRIRTWEQWTHNPPLIHHHNLKKTREFH